MAECCPRQIFAKVSALVRILYQATRELTFEDLCLAACTRRQGEMYCVSCEMEAHVLKSPLSKDLMQ